MKAYRVAKSIEISMIGKSTMLVAESTVMQQVDEYVEVNLTVGSLTEASIFRSPNGEKIYLTRVMVDGLVHTGALVECDA